MEDFTTDIPEKRSVLREYGVPMTEAYTIAGQNHLDQIRYLCRRVERDGAPEDAGVRLAEFFAVLDKARMYFNAMRPEDRAAAQYAVGVRNPTAVRYEPQLADIMMGPHSDLDTDDENYEFELDYRFVELYRARQKKNSGNDVSPREEELIDRFMRFIPRLRAT